jgi:hypothetical protein
VIEGASVDEELGFDCREKRGSARESVPVRNTSGSTKSRALQLGLLLRIGRGPDARRLPANVHYTVCHTVSQRW